jgi:hypothetical protein
MFNTVNDAQLNHHPGQDLFLDGDYIFGNFSSTGAEKGKGLFIPVVELLVDPAGLIAAV